MSTLDLIDHPSQLVGDAVLEALVDLLLKELLALGYEQGLGETERTGEGGMELSGKHVLDGLGC
ncbi:hypothetical protein FZC33_15960 [Labrys sp. KNU-23]|uniref:hypothetical protein n=1 Tax=Labrys sp. KNU-23 TaxID=2789216 RepID=UPI0011EBB372|nr:hypothetical protein [Labrys sp. KNU-23]QEN87721.1 hypothetical protein FZC33_15960 [Labrys sp. KNU-23]